MITGPKLLVVSLLLFGAAGVVYGVLRSTYGQRPAYVHVRWAPTVDTTEREQLERAHSLTHPEQREDRTWGYQITDLSADNLEALVTNPAAEDTHNIHRTAFRIWRTAPRFPYATTRPAWIATLLEFLIRACLGGGAVALAVGGFTTWRARTAPAAGHS